MTTQQQHLTMLDGPAYCPACGDSKTPIDDYCPACASVADTIIITAIPNYYVGYLDGTTAWTP